MPYDIHKLKGRSYSQCHTLLNVRSKKKKTFAVPLHSILSLLFWLHETHDLTYFFCLNYARKGLHSVVTVCGNKSFRMSEKENKR